MLEGLLLTLTKPVPPVPPVKIQREPLEGADLLEVPQVPPVPPEKTKTNAENTKPAEPKTNPAITCKTCIHFESHHAHGGGSGECRAGVMPFGACWWADDSHQCDKYLSSANSEAALNAEGRYFKFLITRPDGTQFYSCSMPRQTITEVREQYSDAATIEPATGEDYSNEE
ncbi:hypothetical protein [Methylomicrobium sp. Wu6]|uniref:hypothetical protein n=1 Tax=Methylomicrobium sp. Wu6 TaxID=3107928 RepID=UPI002DD65030|nr:hypothetical protein [Methylomicrobium sp. Wu6]MEC4747889.1 hypothetical protein [Methylomicrobium sp. Wu6]